MIYDSIEHIPHAYGYNNHLKPLKKLEVENITIRHVGQRIISKQRTAHEIETTAKVSEGGGMYKVITSLGAAGPFEVGQEDSNLRH
jgi:hypothetical protein